MPNSSSLPAASAAGSLPQFSRAKPLAASLGITTRTLFRYSQRGLISRYRLNARVTIYSVAEVTAFITSARV